VRKSLLCLAVLGVSALVSPSFALDTSSIRTIDRTPFNLAEAYPCVVGTYADDLGITPQQLFKGVCIDTRVGPPGASPGTLCLVRKGLILDVNCFSVIPEGQTGPCFVQGFQLIKEVPGSFKCPDVYGLPHFDDKGNLIPYRYFQFGSGVRTWWSLNFTQPGTRFILEVVSVCRTAIVTPGPTVNGVPTTIITAGSPLLHKDRWIWRVVADVNTLRYVIEVMHGGAVSTLEVPCILAEDMYDALVIARQKLEDAIDSSAADRLTSIGNAIFDMEALIVANCLFVEVLNPLVAFPGPDQFGAPNIQPPGNLAQTVFFGGEGSAVAGIIDTIEHPCCCKLLVDLEWISISQGLQGQSPTLPVF
jgi:hypothetical protein